MPVEGVAVRVRRSVLLATAVAVALVLPAAAPGTAAVDETVGLVSADITRAYAGGAYVDGRYVPPDPLPAPDASGGSALARLVADAYAEAPTESVEDAVLALVDPRSLGADLRADDPDPDAPRQPGDPVPSRVTAGDVAAVLPQDDELVVAHLTGRELVDVLEEQWTAGGSFVRFGTPAALTWTYDPQAPVGARVTSVAVDGSWIIDEHEYVVVVTSSLADDADFPTLAGARTGSITAPPTTARAALVRQLDRAYFGVQPDHRQAGVGLSAVPGRLQPGDALTLRVSGLGATSAGAPEDRTLDVTLGDAVLAADVPVVRTGLAGSATIPVVVPSTPGRFPLRVTASPSGTVASTWTLVVLGRDRSWVVLSPERTSQMHGVLYPRVRVRAVVSPLPARPTGTVDVLVDGRPVSTHVLAEASATFDLPASLPAGQRVVTVRYSGDALREPSVSDPLVVTVERTESAATLAVRTPPLAGLPRVWTSEVRLASGARPVGRVELREGTVVRAQARLVAGVAAGTVPTLPAGTHGLTAVFVPDDRGNVAGSTSPRVSVRG